MRNHLSILLIAAATYLSAQENERMFSVGLLGNYQHLANGNFLGPSIDINTVFARDTWPSFGVGLRTGISATFVREEMESDMEFGLLGQTSDLAHGTTTSGTMYLVPVEGYVLMGAGENFLEAGGGFTWAQFDGEQQREAANQRNTYDIQDYRLLPSAHIGYLHRPADRGVMFRMLWKPTWDITHSNYYNGFVAGLGYAF